MSDVVVREAKLFEAGEYPEMGLTVTGDNLAACIAQFTGPVPIKVQHTNTAFDGGMGRVLSVVRRGNELYGQVEFHEVVWKFLDHLGAKKLSAGFDRLWKLVEVSIVNVPRVLTAQVFGDSMSASELIVFSSGFGEFGQGGVEVMSNEYSPEVQAAIVAAQERGRTEGAAAERVKVEAQFAPVIAESAALKRRMFSDSAAVKIAGWSGEGKLPPACQKFAEAILIDGAGSEVTFSDGGHMSAADAFVQFMTHLPASVQVAGNRVAPGDEITSQVEDKVFSALGVTKEEVKAAEDVDRGGLVQ
jgi:hypothetical protein